MTSITKNIECGRASGYRNRLIPGAGKLIYGDIAGAVPLAEVGFGQNGRNMGRIFP